MTLKTNSPNLGMLISGAPGDQHYEELLRQWRTLDALVQPSVISRAAAVPTVGVVDGDRYLLTAQPNLGKIARYSVDTNSVSGWEYLTPKAGWRVHVVSEKLDYQFIDGVWSVASAGGGTTGPITKVANIGPLAWVAGTPLNVTHNLGAIPRICSFKARYKIDANGMTAGSEEFLASIMASIGNGNYGITMRKATSTSCQLVIGANGVLCSTEGGAATSINPSMADLILELWA